ncbi:MAG: hypothetical protein P8H59_05900 [Flavobacteriales bacterium]|nr:hypothetical protein [Flavobacteriales bacterium]MDG1780460.1 hypothetical protein [Flavobacteriales bacterium]MDG2245122.1 hypothetical protein [Flavobacteriales bacterium]
MHNLEPFYNWRNYYIASEDPLSPFFEREYNEFQYHEKVYDHYIHPQWDNIGSSTLFAKVIYADYSDRVAVIELIGEWNDCLHNDIMIFKREIIEHMMLNGIVKFILIGENVLNYHSSDDCYYEEWFEEVEDENGWIALLNFREHVLEDFMEANVDSYFVLGGELDDITWRTQTPMLLTAKISDMVTKRLGPVY